MEIGTFRLGEPWRPAKVQKGRRIIGRIALRAVRFHWGEVWGAIAAPPIHDAEETHVGNCAAELEAFLLGHFRLVLLRNEGVVVNDRNI